MLCKNLKNQLTKNRQNSTCKILSVELENSISRLILKEFQQFWFQNLTLLPTALYDFLSYRGGGGGDFYLTPQKTMLRLFD